MQRRAHQCWHDNGGIRMAVWDLYESEVGSIPVSYERAEDMAVRPKAESVCKSFMIRLGMGCNQRLWLDETNLYE